MPDQHTAPQPILPFMARVEVFTEGEWMPEAQGSSAEWLREALAEARAAYTRVRLVAWWGDVLDEARWIGA